MIDTLTPLKSQNFQAYGTVTPGDVEGKKKM